MAKQPKDASDERVTYTIPEAARKLGIGRTAPTRRRLTGSSQRSGSEIASLCPASRLRPCLRRRARDASQWFAAMAGAAGQKPRHSS